MSLTITNNLWGEPEKTETIQKKIERIGFNWFPAYRRTGARLIYLSPDYKEVRIKLPLNWTTRNYVGTIFGGSMYGAVDPVYMVMLIKLLGPDYLVWVKSANILFEKPGKDTLYARFKIDDQELAELKEITNNQTKMDRTYEVNFVDKSGKVHAIIEKTVYIRKKSS